MRRLALALLLFAAPASADRAAIILPGSYYGSTQAGIDQLQRTIDACELLGISYDLLPQSATPTLQIIGGSINFAGQASRPYGVFIHVSWTSTCGGGGVFAPGYNPDSLWKTATWASRPQIFIAPTTTSGVAFSNCGTCSTGVINPPTTFGLSDRGLSSGAYMVGRPYRWREPGSYYGNMVRTPAKPGGVMRTLLGLTTSPPCLSGACGDTYANYTNLDGYGNITQTNADTGLIIMRYGASGNIANKPASVPNILVWPNAGGQNNPSTFLIWAALAAADSALYATTGGRIIGQTPGWEPRRIGFYISRAFTRADTGKDGRPHDRMSFSCIDVCDSAFFKASLDSINALGIPVTVGVNVDSIASYPYEVAWWKRIRKAEFSVESWNGPTTNGGPTAQDTAGRANAADIFGYRRSRQLQPIGGRAVCAPCIPGDSTLTCLLTYARDRLEAYSLPTSNAIMAPHIDFVPSNYNRGNVPTLDSLGGALLAAKYDHIVVSPNHDNFRNNSFALSGSGVTQPVVTNPMWITSREGKLDVYSGAGHGTRYGTLTVAGTRGYADDPQGDGQPSGIWFLHGSSHPWHNEFLQGALSRRWYGITHPSTAWYVHTFRTPLSVFTIRTGGLMYDYNRTNATRPDYWNLKHIVQMVRVINELNGRVNIDIVHVDDL